MLRSSPGRRTKGLGVAEAEREAMFLRRELARARMAKVVGQDGPFATEEGTSPRAEAGATPSDVIEQRAFRFCRQYTWMLRSVGARVADVYRSLIHPAGTHAVIGGAFDSPKIFRLMRDSSKRGSRPRIAVILSSKDDSKAARAAYFRDKKDKGKIDPSIRRWFAQNGFEPIYVPLTIDTADVWAHDRRLAELIASCDAVYLAGGDQAKHVRCLLDADGSDTPVLRAIRSVAAKGGLVSGSSAGAAAQGGLQYG